MNSKFKLKEVCEITSSKRIFANEYTESGIPFYRSKEIIELSNEQQIREPLFISKERFNEIKKKFNIPQNGDILLSAIGANLGIPYLVNLAFEFYFKDGNVIWFRNFSPKIDSEYLFWWMNTNYFFKQFTDKAIGAAQKALTIDSLNDYLVEVPGIKEQRDITKVLRVISKKVILNNRINVELEAMTKTLYDYWFVQFDFPNEKGKPYKSSGGGMMWSEELKKDIPKNWEVKKLDDIFEFTKGIEPGSSEYLDSKVNNNCIKFFRVGDIEGESAVYVDSKNKKYITAEARDIIVTFDGSVGKLGFGLKGAFSGGLRKIYDKSKKFDNSLIYFIFRDEKIIATIHKYATGSILLHASSSIEHLIIPFEENIYLKFQEIVKPIFDQMVKNKEENQTLTSLRDWLLPMLMNGQIKVK